jgi:hypothetical protein
MVLAKNGAKTMILGGISELKVVGVFDRGIPNKERICIVVNEPTNMGQFGLLIGIQQETSFAYPLRDNFYWFGEGLVSKEDWIFVYTGPGQAKIAPIPGTTSGNLYSLHWDRAETILHNHLFVPILIRMDAVDVHSEPTSLPKSSDDTA